MADTGNKASVYLKAEDQMSPVFQNVIKSVVDLNNSLNSIGKGGMGGGVDDVNDSLKKQVDALKDADAETNNWADSIGGVATKWGAVLAGLISIKEVSDKIIEFYKHGIEVNIQTDEAKNGISGIVASLYDVRDANGNLVEGQDKFRISVLKSQESMKQLKLEALQTGVSVKELLGAYQQAVGPATSSGFKDADTVKITSLIANAAKAMGMGDDQIAQEVRAIFSGDITSDATIGKALQLGAGQANQEAYKKALKAGGDEAAKFLTDLLKNFRFAGIAQSETIGGLQNQLGDIYDLFAGESSKQLISGIMKVKSSFDTLFEVKNNEAVIGSSFQPLVDAMDFLGGVAGDQISSTINSIFSTVKGISEYLATDQTALIGIVETAGIFKDVLGNVFSTFGLIAGSAISVVSSIYDSVTGMQKMKGEADGLKETFVVIADTLSAVNIAIGAVKDAGGSVVNAVKLKIKYGVDLADVGYNGIVDAVKYTFSNQEDKQALILKNLKGLAGFVDSGADKDSFDLMGNMTKEREEGGSNFGIGNALFPSTLNALETGYQARNKIINANDDNSDFKNRLEQRKKEIEELKKQQEELKKYTFSSNLSANDDDKDKNKKKKKEVDRTGEILKLAYDQQMSDYENYLQKERDKVSDQSRYLELDRSQNIISLEDYYNKKNSLSKQDYDVQMDIIDKEIALTKEQYAKIAILNNDQLKQSAEKQSELAKVNKNIEDLNKIKESMKDKGGDETAKKVVAEANARLVDLKKAQKDLEQTVGNDPSKFEVKNQKALTDLANKENDLITKKAKIQQDYAYSNKKDMVDQTNAFKDLANQIMGFDQQIQELLGNRGESRKIQLELDTSKLREQYQNNPQALERINQIDALKQKQNDYNTYVEDLNNLYDAQNNKIETINILKDKGYITELEQGAKVKAINLEYIGQLETQMANLQKIYETTSDPAVLNNIDALKNKILELKLSLDPIKETIDTTFKESLGTELMNVIKRTESFSDAVKNLGESIGNVMLNLATQQVAMQASNALFGTGQSQYSIGSFFSQYVGSNSTFGNTNPTSNSVGLFGQLANMIGIGSRAGGGTLADNSWSLVGENGAELVKTGNGGTQVYNSSQTRTMLNGNGGQVNNNIVFNVKDAKSLRENRGKIERQVGRLVSSTRRNM